MTTSLTVNYEAGHSYNEEWESLDLHCPACGKRETWREIGPGDYEIGEKYLCRACGAGFYLPLGVWTGTQGRQNQQRLDALRAAH